jgi:Ala-tRNA(Pro) deacylase
MAVASGAVSGARLITRWEYQVRTGLAVFRPDGTLKVGFGGMSMNRADMKNPRPQHQEFALCHHCNRVFVVLPGGICPNCGYPLTATLERFSNNVPPPPSRMRRPGGEGESVMMCRDRLEQLFRSEGVPFQAQTHRPVYTAQEIAKAEDRSGYEVAKVVLAVVDENLVMLVLPAPYRVDLSKLRQALVAGSARLAVEHEFATRFPDCDVGAMPPFGNLYDLKVYVDPALARDTMITFAAGGHEETMTISYQDFERLVRPVLIGFSTPPQAVRIPQTTVA